MGFKVKGDHHCGGFPFCCGGVGCVIFASRLIGIGVLRRRLIRGFEGGRVSR